MSYWKPCRANEEFTVLTKFSLLCNHTLNGNSVFRNEMKDHLPNLNVFLLLPLPLLLLNHYHQNDIIIIIITNTITTMTTTMMITELVCAITTTAIAC